MIVLSVYLSSNGLINQSRVRQIPPEVQDQHGKCIEINNPRLLFNSRVYFLDGGAPLGSGKANWLNCAYFFAGLNAQLASPLPLAFVGSTYGP